VKKSALVFILFTLCAGFVFSFDFGLLLDQNIEAENNYFSYTPEFIPWFVWNNGQGASLYLSGIISLKYENDGLRKPVILPELSRFLLLTAPINALLKRAALSTPTLSGKPLPAFLTVFVFRQLLPSAMSA